jgi:hypothetical protein
MAELLVKAKAHWMDDFTQDQVDAMTDEGRRQYLSRHQAGDIIVVRSDGWEWGKLECLPDFVIVKIPGMAEEDAKMYEGALMDTSIPEKPVLVRCCKYSIPSAVPNYIPIAQPIGKIGMGSMSNISAGRMAQPMSVDSVISAATVSVDDLPNLIVEKTGDPSEVVQPQ